MGGVIIDGRAFLRFKGPIAGLKKALIAIETIPVPEYAKIAVIPLTGQPMMAFTVQIMVNGIPATEFGETITKIEMAVEKLANMGWIIDTCPPWPRPWPGPTPKVEEGLSTWVITIRQE